MKYQSSILSKVDSIQYNCLEILKIIESLRLGDNTLNDEILEKLKETTTAIGIDATFIGLALPYVSL